MTAITLISSDGGGNLGGTGSQLPGGRLKGVFYSPKEGIFKVFSAWDSRRVLLPWSSSLPSPLTSQAGVSSLPAR